MDNDECQRKKNPVCQHKCLNTKGSYRCSCHPGYRLRHDYHTCEGKEKYQRVIPNNICATYKAIFILSNAIQEVIAVAIFTKHNVKEYKMEKKYFAQNIL